MSNDNFASIEIEDAKFIFFTNFKGAPGPYNNEGDRNFNVILQGDALKQAEEYGMNIKYTKPRDGEDPVPYIKVNVGFKIRAPHIELINSHCKRYLTEQNVGLLDDYKYETVDMVIRPNRWRRPDGSSGVNAYLEALYAVVVEDRFVSKYYDIPDASELEE